MSLSLPGFLGSQKNNHLLHLKLVFFYPKVQLPNFAIQGLFLPSPKTMTVLNPAFSELIGVANSLANPSDLPLHAANSSFLSVLPVCDVALPEAGASFYRRKDDKLIALRFRASRHILSTPRPLSLCRSPRILHTIQLLPTPAASA